MVDEKNAAPPDSRGASVSAKRRKWVMGICVTAVVIVAAVGAFLVWHEQPSFCNAVCHTPMNTYVESLSSSDSAVLASTHGKVGKTCLDCHPSNLGEQVTEGMHWVTGNYAYDDATERLVSRSGEMATQEFCLNEACHNYTLDSLREETADQAWNPHDFTEHGVTDCGSCHKMHERSVMVCSECHYLSAENVPEGWDAIPYREKR